MNRRRWLWAAFWVAIFAAAALMFAVGASIDGGNLGHLVSPAQADPAPYPVPPGPPRSAINGVPGAIGPNGVYTQPCTAAHRCAPWAPHQSD